MNKLQINDFIETYNIQNVFTNAFTSLLEQNTCEELGVTDKNLSIDVEHLEFELSDFNMVAFKSAVEQNNNKIGYYKLIFTSDGELADDFFIIY